MTHELGHHVHLDGGLAPSLDTEIERAFNARVQTESVKKDLGRGPRTYQRFTKQDVVSDYARTNPQEWFAETHAAYVYHREDLKAFDPKAFDLVRRVRKSRGIVDT